MKFKTPKEYIEYLDEQSGESWSNVTDELADAMGDYAKMYHEHELKLLGMANVVQQREQLKAFVNWWHGLSQEELVWYEGKYVEVFLSL